MPLYLLHYGQWLNRFDMQMQPNAKPHLSSSSWIVVFRPTRKGVPQALWQVRICIAYYGDGKGVHKRKIAVARPET